MSKKQDNVNPETREFVSSVMSGKNADAGDLLEKIVRRKVEKHIRKTLRSQAGR